MDPSGEKTQLKKRKAKWSYEAEELLLVLWAQNVTKLCRNRKKFYIFAKMSNKMEEMGYPFTAFEISVKIHNLKSRYKEELKRIAEGFPSQWPMYDSVHRIMEMSGSIKIEEGEEEKQNHNNSSEQFTSAEKQEQVFEDEENEMNDATNENGDFDNFYNENSIDNADDSTTTVSSQRNIKKKNHNGKRKCIKYLKSINENLTLLVEKINDLSKQSQALKRERNTSIKELLNVLKMPEEENERVTKIKTERPLKKIKLSNSVDLNQEDDYDNFCHLIQEDDPLCDETNIKTDVDISGNIKSSSGIEDYSATMKNEFLKTKQLEKNNMTEKNKMEMKILNTDKDL